ncbi:MAG: flagellar motor switch protein FliM [Proteobacteria bacterium]|nr:flagellar motor switch protein FliM [Pseudomonadota bacterium]
MAEEQKTPASGDAAKDEAAMAAEWAAAAEGGGGSPAAENKTLSQDEIDSLLGFGGGGAGSKTGIRALLDRALLSYERLPMLEVVFDRFVRTLSTSLRNFTSDNVDIVIDSITSMRFEDYMNSVELPCLLSIFQAVEWENYGLITINSSLTYSMVDVLLGGGRVNHPVKVEGRPFTTIEQDIVKSLATLMLDDMSSSFNPLTPITFRLERIETNPRFATITRPSNAVIVVTLKIDMEGKGGRADILIPYATLEPVKELLVQLFAGESFGDSSWEDFFFKEIRSMIVDIEAVWPEKAVTLKDIANLTVGSTIMLDNSPEDPILLRCKGIDMLSGKIGSVDSSVAVQVSEVINKVQEEDLV